MEDLFGEEGPARIAEEEEEEPQACWVPTQLAETQIRERQQVSDEAACQNVPCQLCSTLDNLVDQCGEFIKRIFEMETKFRGKVAPTVLYEIMATRYNSTVYRRTLEYYGEEGTRQRGIAKLTVPMVRRHYEQRHVRSPARRLWEIADYQQNCLMQLQRASLWQQNLTDPSAAKQPNVPNFKIMMDLNREYRANILLADRLEKQA